MAGIRRVFIAEDDEIALTSLKRLVTLSGFEVMATKNPKEIAQLVKMFRPDVILLDLMMPEIGGFEICKILNDNKETQGIPIIIISALADDMDIKAAYKLGVVDYFTKPYNFKDLLKQMNKAIASKRESI